MIAGKIYTVSEVTRIVKGLFRKEPEFANLQIQGEVSNFRQYPSGHCYFNLKDGKTLLKAVMFAGAARRLKQLPKNGDQVLGVGRIDLYERDGVYQFYVDMMMPLGAGNLMIAYEQLKEKLTAEGLFDPGRKRPLPAYPKVVGIVTSPAGAAVRDIINVAGRRDPSVKLRLYPVKVQGTEAPPEIIRGIRFMNRHKLADVLIVGRGGGSMEDLWAFNDEGVVRAIAASEIPVISAVGHEIDFTLSDFAADLRHPPLRRQRNWRCRNGAGTGKSWPSWSGVWNGPWSSVSRTAAGPWKNSRKSGCSPIRNGSGKMPARPWIPCAGTWNRRAPGGWRNVSRSWISWQPSWGRWTRTECSGGAIPLRKMPREGPSGSRRTCTLVIPW